MACTTQHTIRLRFDDTPEDQALYVALLASCDQDCRTPLPRQIKYQLLMAMGLIRPDSSLLKRIGLSSIVYAQRDLAARLDRMKIEFAANAAAAYEPPSPTRPATTLRLVPADDRQ